MKLTQFILITSIMMSCCLHLQAQPAVAAPVNPSAEAEWAKYKSGEETWDQFRENIAHIGENQFNQRASNEAITASGAISSTAPLKKSFSLTNVEDYISIRKSFLTTKDDEAAPISVGQNPLETRHFIALT